MAAIVSGVQLELICCGHAIAFENRKIASLADAGGSGVTKHFVRCQTPLSLNAGNKKGNKKRQEQRVSKDDLLLRVRRIKPRDWKHALWIDISWDGTFYRGAIIREHQADKLIQLRRDVTNGDTARAKGGKARAVKVPLEGIVSIAVYRGRLRDPSPTTIMTAHITTQDAGEPTRDKLGSRAFKCPAQVMMTYFNGCYSDYLDSVYDWDQDIERLRPVFVPLEEDKGVPAIDVRLHLSKPPVNSRPPPAVMPSSATPAPILEQPKVCLPAPRGTVTATTDVRSSSAISRCHIGPDPMKTPATGHPATITDLQPWLATAGVLTTQPKPVQDPANGPQEDPRSMVRGCSPAGSLARSATMTAHDPPPSIARDTSSLTKSSPREGFVRPHLSRASNPRHALVCEPVLDFGNITMGSPDACPVKIPPGGQSSTTISHTSVLISASPLRGVMPTIPRSAPIIPATPAQEPCAISSLQTLLVGLARDVAPQTLSEVPGMDQFGHPDDLANPLVSEPLFLTPPKHLDEIDADELRSLIELLDAEEARSEAMDGAGSSHIGKDQRHHRDKARAVRRLDKPARKALDDSTQMYRPDKDVLDSLSVGSLARSDHRRSHHRTLGQDRPDLRGKAVAPYAAEGRKCFESSRPRVSGPRDSVRKIRKHERKHRQEPYRHLPRRDDACPGGRHEGVIDHRDESGTRSGRSSLSLHRVRDVSKKSSTTPSDSRLPPSGNGSGTAVPTPCSPRGFTELVPARPSPPLARVSGSRGYESRRYRASPARDSVQTEQRIKTEVSRKRKRASAQDSDSSDIEVVRIVKHGKHPIASGGKAAKKESKPLLVAPMGRDVLSAIPSSIPKLALVPTLTPAPSPLRPRPSRYAPLIRRETTILQKRTQQHDAEFASLDKSGPWRGRPMLPYGVVSTLTEAEHMSPHVCPRSKARPERGGLYDERPATSRGTVPSSTKLEQRCRRGESHANLPRREGVQSHRVQYVDLSSD